MWDWRCSTSAGGPALLYKNAWVGQVLERQAIFIFNQLLSRQVLLKLGANKDARGVNQGATACYLSSLLGHRDCLRCFNPPSFSGLPRA